MIRLPQAFTKPHRLWNVMVFTFLLIGALLTRPVGTFFVTVGLVISLLENLKKELKGLF